MAEMVVNLVMEELELLIEESRLFGRVREDAVRIGNELQLIRPFLRDADARTEGGEIEDFVMVWMRQLRKVCLQLEDVIDRYKLGLAQSQLRQGHGLFYCLGKVCHRHIMSRQKIAQDIHDIATSIRELQDRGNLNGLRVIEEGGSSRCWKNNPRVDSFFIEEVDNRAIHIPEVGVKSPEDDLRVWVAEEASPNRTVISVVGAAGLGKTTLVNKIYMNQIEAGNFLCHAWITVSHSYKIEKLLKGLIRQLYLYETTEQSPPHEVETMDEPSLIRMLGEYLQEKRYLVVLDDVWSTELWGSIKIALPGNNKSSRVIITTRENDVASSFKTSEFDHVLKLTPLTHDRAMELFYRRVFPSGSCPQNLMKLAEKIVKKCHGLPLAIVVIGGMLSTKMSVFEWQRVYDSLPLNRILSSSYLDLPYFLKLCLLYFCILPEDYSVNHGRLVRSWIAEGFIRERRGKTLEEIAEEYLTELLQRSLVQVSRVNSIGKARSYRVHGLRRELILSKGEHIGLCKLWSEEDSCFDEQTRRLSIHNRGDNVLNDITQSQARSVFTFGEDKLPGSFVSTLTENLKLVKVLDFEDAPINFLPEEVGNLLLLKYLGLRNTKVKTLPKSIGRLCNLLVLDLKNSLVSELPYVINRLLKLRHLLVYVRHQTAGFEQDYTRGVKIHEGFGCLESLQKLYFVEAYHGRGLFRELAKLRQLRKLGIKNLKTKDGEALCTAIENMSHLQTLDVLPVQKDDILDLQHISSPPLSLQQLYLKGRLESFPSWISKLQNLVTINLRWSRLRNDPLEFLQDLPSLLELVLVDAYVGEELQFKEGGFLKLRVVELRAMNALISVIVKRGAMPLLKTSHVSSCPQLTQLAREIEEKRKYIGGEAPEC